jgi:hypothetical protein
LRDATVRAAAHVLSPAFGGAPQPELGSPLPEPAAAPAEEFSSLVPLPELPELLRPEVPGGITPASGPSPDGTDAVRPGSDPDNADTDLDLVQSRPDAATAS